MFGNGTRESLAYEIDFLNGIRKEVTKYKPDGAPIRGETVVQLRSTLSGNLVKEIRSENIINNCVYKLAYWDAIRQRVKDNQTSSYFNDYIIDDSYNKNWNMLAAMLLTDYTGTENADDKYAKGVVTGWSHLREGTTGDDPYKGTPNLLEQAIEDTRAHFVVDFPEEAANGTFQSIYLGPDYTYGDNEPSATWGAIYRGKDALWEDIKANVSLSYSWYPDAVDFLGTYKEFAYFRGTAGNSTAAKIIIKVDTSDWSHTVHTIPFTSSYQTSAWEFTALIDENHMLGRQQNEYYRQLNLIDLTNNTVQVVDIYTKLGVSLAPSSVSNNAKKPRPMTVHNGRVLMRTIESDLLQHYRFLDNTLSPTGEEYTAPYTRPGSTSVYDIMPVLTPNGLVHRRYDYENNDGKKAYPMYSSTDLSFVGYLPAAIWTHPYSGGTWNPYLKGYTTNNFYKLLQMPIGAHNRLPNPVTKMATNTMKIQYDITYESFNPFE